MNDLMPLEKLLESPTKIIKSEPGTIVWVPATSSRDRQVLKLYRRRGILNATRCRITRFRVQREYDHLNHLAHWGVPCTEAQSWAQGYSSTHGFYELLATGLLEDSVDIETCLRRGKTCDLRSVFKAVRKMHESGCIHHALYSRNVLISKDESGNDKVAICDMARSRIITRSVVGTRLARVDVASLVNDLVRQGASRQDIPYRAYGFSTSDFARLERLIDGFANSKLRRVVRDSESRIRCLVTCCIDLMKRNRRSSKRGPRTWLQSENESAK